MKKFAILLSVLCALLFVNSSYAAEYVEGEAIITVRTGITLSAAKVTASAQKSMAAAASQAAQAANAKLVQTFLPVNGSSSLSKTASSNTETLAVAHVRSASGETTKELIARLKKNPNVVDASPNHIYRISKEPNDTSWSEQWGPKKIRAAGAWDKGTGSKDVVVVVMDTGIIYDHEDLADNMFKITPALIASMDSKASGIISSDFENSHGVWYHCKNDTKTPMVPVPVGPVKSTDIATSADIMGTPERQRIVGDISGHGTHVAGIIGAVGDNGKGVAGMNWKVSLMAVNVFSKTKDGSKDTTTAYDSDIMRGIDFVLTAKAAGANIRVVNMSFTGWNAPRGADNANELKMKALSDSGIIVVIAAGNHAQNIDSPTGIYSRARPYPACSRYANTITVGATTQNGTSEVCAEYSNYSSSGKWVDVFAPGTDILSTCRKTPIISSEDTYSGTGYIKISGTSMASPMVAGTAALLCSIYPEKTATEIKAMILNGADPNIMKGGYSAYGRIDAYNAAFNIRTTPIASGDGGGCTVGFAAAALLAALPLIIRRERKGK